MGEIEMGLYDDVIEFLARVENPKKQRMNSRKRLTRREVDKLLKKFPDAPKDYVAYLREVGAGPFRECAFAVYGFLGTLDEVLGEGVLVLRDPTTKVLCFGDNFSGDLSGFLPNSKWAVVEVLHESGSLHRVKKTFGKFIREQMLMGPRGEDLRISKR